MKFYPNPAASAINFDFQRGYDNSFSLLIFNFMGKKVYEIKNTPSRINLNLEDFYRGIYVFQLRDKNGATLESGKFQVLK
ncbi:MAG: T9SS type A sorting domain-containing protein [Ferruginibacter sp.]|nr:T9SS type A sorting domain-containing protein [Ferruginibacter sp.]